MIIPENINIYSIKGKVRKNITSKNQYIAQYIKGIYIVIVYQPKVLYHFSIIIQIIDLKEEDMIKFNKVIK